MNTSNDRLKDSVKIGYNMAINSFKENDKKKKLGIYYYVLFNIPMTLPGLPTQANDEEFKKSEGECKVGVKN